MKKKSKSALHRPSAPAVTVSTIANARALSKLAKRQVKRAKDLLKLARQKLKEAKVASKRARKFVAEMQKNWKKPKGRDARSIATPPEGAKRGRKAAPAKPAARVLRTAAKRKTAAPAAKRAPPRPKRARVSRKRTPAAPVAATGAGAAIEGTIPESQPKTGT